MKKTFALAIFCCLFAFLATAQTNYEVKQSNYSGVEISFSASPLQVQGVLLDGQDYCRVSMENFISLNQTGKPDLPSLVKLVEMPLGSGLTYDILGMVCDTIEGADLNAKYPVAPAQPSRRKSDNSTLPFMKDASLYASSLFWGDEVITLSPVGVARDRNLAEVHFNPVKWNPATNQYIICKSITVRVRMAQPDIAATKTMKQLHHSPAFNGGVEVINQLDNKAVSLSAPLRYMIIAHSGFRGELDEFVAWKKRQGYMVEVYYTDDPAVGSDTAHIRAFLKGQYTNATPSNPAPTFVLFVGDNEQIPAYYCVTGSGWDASSHYSDLYYTTWSSGDIIPDCYYGRFSAQNVNQLSPQISKTLLYEQYAFEDPSYLSKAILIAGEDRGNPSDNAYLYADPAMDYVAKTYVNASNGFSEVKYYKNNTSVVPAGVTVTGSSQSSTTASALRNLYNEGYGWINYSAHGSDDEWSIPQFTNTHVNAMSNNGMPSVMIGNCCLTNSFQYSTCFGEALLRKGGNAGAVVYFGGSDYTYWGEDFYWEVGVRTNISNSMNANYDANHLGMYDRLFHTHGENQSLWHIYAGSMNMAGNLAVQSSTSSLKNYYWEVYHLMGDPSLLPWLGEAATMNLSSNSQVLFVGSNSLSVTAAPYAYVALTDQEHNLVGAAFADASGNAQLTFPMINTPGIYEIAATAQNYRPAFAAIEAVVADGPFLMIDSVWTAGNLVAGDTIDFGILLENIGTEPVSSFSVEFITDGNVLMPLLHGQDTVNETVNAENTHVLNYNQVCKIWNTVPDNTTTDVTVIVRWGTHNTEICRKQFSFSIAAADMALKNHSFSTDFAPDATVTLSVVNKNYGHAMAKDISATLISIDPFFTLSNATQSTININPGSVWNTSYTLHCGANIPESGLVPLIQVMTFDGRQHKDTIWLAFGQGTQENFESGNLNSYAWTNNDYPWFVTNDGAHSGAYCAKSYTFNYNGSSNQSKLSIQWTSTIDDSISFWHKVSSENNYDWFRFYIDQVSMEQSSGTDNDWQRSSYFVPAGTHTFTFAYEKDYSVNNGSDCAWIDDIVFPLSGEARSYILDTICQGENYTFIDSTISGLAPGTYHFQHHENMHSWFLQLEVSPQPQITIEASASQIRSGEPVFLQAHGGDRYLWSTGETVEMFYAYPTQTTTYSVTGWAHGCSATAHTTITVSGTIGINDAMLDPVHVFPNPATDHLVVRAEGMNQVLLYNTLGKVVSRLDLQGNEASLSLNNLTNGVYIIRIQMQDGSYLSKKIIKR